MTRRMLGFLGLLVLLPALRAGDKPDTPTPAQQYQALEKEYRKAQADFRKALADAKTREEQLKVFEEKNPRPDKFAVRFFELAEKYPKDPAAVDALVWTAIRGGRDLRPKAIKILLRDHIQDEKMATACPQLAFTFQDKDIQELLRAILEKSKHRAAQAQACLALARGAENRASLARRFKEQPGLAKNYEAFMGKETVEALVDADPETLSKDVEALYERVVKDFADVADREGGTVGDRAKDKLEAMHNPITVGKPAPEIDGEDVGGKKFKLSDYRGKVVLLDFWGHW